MAPAPGREEAFAGPRANIRYRPNSAVSNPGLQGILRWGMNSRTACSDTRFIHASVPTTFMTGIGEKHEYSGAECG